MQYAASMHNGGIHPGNGAWFQGAKSAWRMLGQRPGRGGTHAHAAGQANAAIQSLQRTRGLLNALGALHRPVPDHERLHTSSTSTSVGSVAWIYKRVAHVKQ